jgi:hypothetical protein
MAFPKSQNQPGTISTTHHRQWVHHRWEAGFRFGHARRGVVVDAYSADLFFLILRSFFPP